MSMTEQEAADIRKTAQNVRQALLTFAAAQDPLAESHEKGAQRARRVAALQPPPGRKKMFATKKDVEEADASHVMYLQTYAALAESLEQCARDCRHNAKTAREAAAKL